MRGIRLVLSVNPEAVRNESSGLARGVALIALAVGLLGPFWLFRPRSQPDDAPRARRQSTALPSLNTSSVPDHPVEETHPPKFSTDQSVVIRLHPTSHVGDPEVVLTTSTAVSFRARLSAGSARLSGVFGRYPKLSSPGYSLTLWDTRRPGRAQNEVILDLQPRVATTTVVIGLVSAHGPFIIESACAQFQDGYAHAYDPLAPEIGKRWTQATRDAVFTVDQLPFSTAFLLVMSDGCLSYGRCRSGEVCKLGRRVQGKTRFLGDFDGAVLIKSLDPETELYLRAKSRSSFEITSSVELPTGRYLVTTTETDGVRQYEAVVTSTKTTEIRRERTDVVSEPGYLAVRVDRAHTMVFVERDGVVEADAVIGADGLAVIGPLAPGPVTTFIVDACGGSQLVNVKAGATVEIRLDARDNVRYLPSSGVTWDLHTSVMGRFVVSHVHPDGPFHHLGLRAGDVVHTINGTPIASVDDLTCVGALESSLRLGLEDRVLTLPL